VEELIQPPHTSADFGAEPARLPVVAPTDPDDPAPFANQPPADFARRENRDAYAAALAAVRGRFGRHYPLRIGGRDIDTARSLPSVNPAAPDEVVGTVAYGGRAEQKPPPRPRRLPCPRGETPRRPCAPPCCSRRRN